MKEVVKIEAQKMIDNFGKEISIKICEQNINDNILITKNQHNYNSSNVSQINQNIKWWNEILEYIKN